MPTINFRGARLKHADLRRKGEGAVLTRLHLAADFSEPVCQEMGWNHGLKDEVASAKFDNSISSGHLVLTPSSRDLKTHEIQMSFEEGRDFQMVAQTDDEGEIIGAELRFVVSSADPNAMNLADAWVRNMGDSTANLRLRYAEQAKITEEQMQAAKDAEPIDTRQGVLPDISITGGHGRKRKTEVN